MKKIIIIIPYFGKFPEWADLFFETIRRNDTIDFYFFTDCNIEDFPAPNIRFEKMSFREYIDHANAKTGLEFNPSFPYKLCDLRPLYAFIHQDIIEGYDIYGWTDMDILFGDIRSFYTDEILSEYNIFSTHEIRLSGHFSLFKNNKENVMLFKKIYNWKEALYNEKFVGIDEHGITNACTQTVFDKINEKYGWKMNNFITRFFSKRKKRKIYLVEQFTTPFTSIPWLDGSIDSDQPDTWYYIDGKITNSRDKKRNFIYLHLMNFKSSQWRHDGTKAPWENKEKICFAKVEDMVKGLKINKEGISLIDTQ